MPDLVIRPAVQNDLDALWEFLAMAAYEPDAAAARAEPGVAAYLIGWRRPQDFGFIAERDTEIVGAAWASKKRFSNGDERTPKVSIAVKPEARGQDVGQKLLRALIVEAGRRGVGLCLSVRTENPARRLYERVGFRIVSGSTVANRAGGTSIAMIFDKFDNIGNQQ